MSEEVLQRRSLHAEIGEEGMSLAFRLLARSVCCICEIKKAVISWKQILCHTDGSVPLQMGG